MKTLEIESIPNATVVMDFDVRGLGQISFLRPAATMVNAYLVRKVGAVQLDF